MTAGAAMAILLPAAVSAATAGEPGPAYAVTGDAIAAPLTGRAGDPARGERLIADRRTSLCVLCHTGPFPDPHLHGTIAPDLSGVGRRLTEGQIRLRVVDMRRLNPATVMPSFLRADGGAGDGRRVATAWRGKPILTAAEIEDIVAYLATLTE